MDSTGMESDLRTSPGLGKLSPGQFPWPQHSKPRRLTPQSSWPVVSSEVAIGCTLDPEWTSEWRLWTFSCPGATSP